MIRSIFILILLTFSTSVAAAPWNLPLELTDDTASVSFEVDSTWHTVHGTTQGITGKAWLADTNDFRSVRAELSLPVAAFNTDNRRRDKRLREVMAEPEFPRVVFKLTRVDDICAPDSLAIGASCPAVVGGELTIRHVTKPISMTASVKRTGQGFEVTGRTVIQWQEFGIEDPSILIAKVDEDAAIDFSIHLTSTRNNAEAK